MKTALSLIEAVTSHGATLTRLQDGRLWLSPSDVVPPALVERLREHREELLALVPIADDIDTSEISWRVAAMLPHVPPHGAICGLLTAREGAWPADGQHCVSCGDYFLPDVAARSGPLGFTIRCELCR